MGRDSACPGQHFQLLPSDFLIIPPDLPTAGGGMEEWDTRVFCRGWAEGLTSCWKGSVQGTCCDVVFGWALLTQRSSLERPGCGGGNGYYAGSCASSQGEGGHKASGMHGLGRVLEPLIPASDSAAHT